MSISISDWFIGGLFLAFLIGVIMYSYYEIRIKLKK